MERENLTRPSDFFPKNLDFFIFVIAISLWIFSSSKTYFCGCKYLPFEGFYFSPVFSFFSSCILLLLF